MPHGWTMSRSRKSRALTALTAALAVLLAACNPQFGTTSGPAQHASLTTAVGEVFAYSGDGGTVAVSGPATNTDPEIRELFWNEDGPYLADQQACHTWHNPTGSLGGDTVQPGLAMRIAPSGPDGDGVKGITVNENIWAAAIWVFWVNVWDSSTPGRPFQGVQSFDLSPVVGKFWVADGEFHSNLVPGPWHVCARTQALDLTFKVWTGDNPEPAWDDPVHVRTTTLPEGWDHAGYSGGYVGHVNAGETAVFSGQTSVPLCLLPDMIDTDYCQAALDDISGAPPGVQ